MSGDVFDLDACEREQHGEPFRFALGGREFVLPRFDGLDRRVLDAMGDGDLAFARAALAAGLGDQREAFEALPLSMAGYNRLVREWTAHAGVEPGESPRSAGS